MILSLLKFHFKRIKMYIYKGFITEKTKHGKEQRIFVTPENPNDMDKCFTNIIIPDEEYIFIHVGSPILLVLEYKESSCPIAISVDGTKYYKSKNKEARARAFRAIKNEFHNIIDTKKNKLKFLKSFFIPFYSNLIPYPYYVILSGFFALFFSFLYTSDEISNIKFLMYSIGSTYLSSLFFIGFNIINIKKMYRNGKRWIKK